MCLWYMCPGNLIAATYWKLIIKIYSVKFLSAKYDCSYKNVKKSVKKMKRKNYKKNVFVRGEWWQRRNLKTLYRTWQQKKILHVEWNFLSCQDSSWKFFILPSLLHSRIIKHYRIYRYLSVCAHAADSDGSRRLKSWEHMLHVTLGNINH